MGSKRINKYKIQLFLYLSIMVISFASSFIVFLTVIRPVFVKRLQYYAHAAATETINNAIYDTFSEENEFSDIIYIDKNNDGTIRSLSADTVQMNRLRAQLAKKIDESLKESDSGYICIALGNLFGNELLAGFGPDIKIKIHPIGTTDIDWTDNFEACGINQSRHTIYIVASVEIAIIAPQLNTTNTVSAKIPIAETVIVGEVPKYYGTNFNTVFEEQ